MRKPNKTITSPKPDCSNICGVKIPPKYSPNANGKAPTRNRNPVAEMKRSLSMPRAIRYMATGGDQIELTPPRTPDTIPNPSCQPMPGPMLNLNPISPFSATMIMATPIEIVKSAVGYDAIKSEVIKMLTRMAAPKIQ